MNKDTRSIKWWRWWAVGGFVGWYLETAWFGFNLTAQSPLEHALDGFFSAMMLTGVIACGVLRFRRRQLWRRFAMHAFDPLMRVGSVSLSQDGDQRVDINARVEASAIAADEMIIQYDKRWE
jgi:hypothetical protein